MVRFGKKKRTRIEEQKVRPKDDECRSFEFHWPGATQLLQRNEDVSNR